MKRLIPTLAIGLLFFFNIFATEGGDAKTEQNQSVLNNPKIHSFYGLADGVKLPEKADPLEMSYRFFELNREKYHIGNPRQELIKRWVRGDNISTTVSLKQVYNGIDLMHSDIRLHFDGGRRLKEVTGTYIYDINLSTTPQIDSASAENLALKDLGFPENAKVFKNEQYSTHLTIWRDNNGKFRLIWVLWVRQEYPKSHSWEYYIDAHDGTVLSKVDIIRHDNWDPVKK